ncbi:hypothetical protein GAYE_SCF37G5137 [Galdieria yellowstonensis]|uniref:DUF202 domain-containing protein n=1 Tax=Galdieria yellowstonensis TaxID=3028027 RepID=A0AAV9IIC9_9RHOD|nr:hypothetical protein GAYE_SCF37G5137 [Galdieria yellowstonensis]
MQTTEETDIPARNYHTFPYIHISELENLLRYHYEPIKGSLARDHLANERTWLAWLRTSLTIMGFGLVVIDFLKNNFAGKVIAAVLIALGVFCAVYAAFRYYRLMQLIEKREFSVEIIGPWVSTTVTVCLILCTIVLALS